MDNELDALQGNQPGPDATAVMAGGYPNELDALNGVMPSVQQDATVTAPAIRDLALDHPDLAAAAVHHSRLADAAKIMGNMLLGPTTPHLVQNPDGTMIVQQQPSTGGEKWGRLAAAALLGAAKGFSVGQGPGGAGRALGAGLEVGQGAQQQQQDYTQQRADQANKDMLNSANMAALHQRYVMNSEQMRQGNIKFGQEQADRQNKINEDFANSAAIDEGEFEGVMDLPTFTAQHPNVLPAHMGQNGQTAVLLPVFGKDGTQTGTHVYVMNRDTDNERMTAPPPLQQAYYDGVEKKVKYNTLDLPHGITRGDYATRVQAMNVANSNLELSVAKQKQEEAQNPPELVQAKVAHEKAETGLAYAQSLYAKAQSAKDYYMMGLDPNGKPTTRTDPNTGKALHGEDYLATLDPQLAIQVKNTANGHLPYPSPRTNNPQANLLRNAVNQYDPSYSTQRYDNMSNFTTKGDSAALTQMTTGLEHADRALANSKAIGGGWLNPAARLGTRFASPTEAAYSTDIEYLKGEVGRLVAGKAITQKEGDKLTENMESGRQDVRDAAINETMSLTGSKVKALFEKFKRGSNGQELPAEDFLSPDTIERMNRFGWKTGATPPPPPPSQTTGQIPPPTAPPAPGGKTLPASIAHDPSWAINAVTGEVQHWDGTKWATATPPAQ